MERTRIPDRESSLSIVEEDDEEVFSMAEKSWIDRGFECQETVVSSVDILGDPVVLVRYLLESNTDRTGEYMVILEDESIRRRMLECSQSEDVDLFVVDENGLKRVM